MGQGKTNQISWFSILLILLNIGLLFTVWYMHWRSVGEVKSSKADTDSHQQQTQAVHENLDIERYLREELHFSEQQVLSFKQKQANHLPRANALRQKTYRLRQEIITLLFNDNPNKSRIEELSYELGLTHEKLEKEIFFHFMDLMAICQSEQRERFKQLLRQVFEKYRPPQYPGTETAPADEKAMPPEIKNPNQNSPQMDNNNNNNNNNININRNRGPVQRDMENLQQRLDLTAEQSKQIEKVLQDFHDREQQMDRRGEDFKAFKDQVDQQIEALLTPQQVQQFRKYKEETRDQKRAEKK